MRILLFALVLGMPLSALAQEDGTPITEDIEKEVKEAEAGAEAKEKGDGFTWSVNLGLAGSLLHSQAWVGQDEGLTLQGGILFRGDTAWRVGDHEWRNGGSLEHQQTMTPTIPRFIKSADALDVYSLYMYRPPTIPWLGPYGRVRFNTALLPGFAIRPEPTTVNRLKSDGTPVVDGNGDPVVITTQTYEDDIPLTNWFEPAVLYESAGVFAEPYTSDPFTINFKLGIGGQHIFTQNGFVLADDDATAELETIQLQNVHSMGAEFETQATGIVYKDIANWALLVNLYYPFLLSITPTIGMDELLNVDVTGNLNFKLNEWLNLAYVLRVKRVPLILNDWQIQNSLLLNASFSGP